MTMFGSQWLANAGATHEIEQSVRFNDGDTSYMDRTPGSAGNDNTFTISFWLKRGEISGPLNQDSVLGAGDGADMGGYGRNDAIGFYNDVIQIFTFSGFGANLRTTAVYRDPGSWYHFVVRYDDTQSTSTDRVRLYVNSVQVTSFSPATYPDQNEGCSFNAALLQRIGANTVATTRNIDGYLAEMVMIDGTSLGPDSFGEINSDTGQWVPIDVSDLTFGTNGFHITGANSSDLGEDFSGNNNDFATTNLAETDQMSDSPTNNHCTWNPLQTGTNITSMSDGNLVLSGTSGAANKWMSLGTMPVSSGKWYYEVTSGGARIGAGFTTSGSLTQANLNTGPIDVAAETFVILNSGEIYYGTTTDSNAPAFGSGVTMGFALDADAGKAWVTVNGSDWADSSNGTSGDPTDGSNPTWTQTIGTPVQPLCGDPSGGSFVTLATTNFGQSAFAYTPPTGYNAWNTDNLPAPAIEDPSAYFQTTLYEGDGSTQSIDQDGNSTFSPNFVWIKNRDATDAHALFDTVRGATKVLSSNSTAAEATNADTLTAFESDGFALGDDVIVNTNAESYVAWQWNEGATPGLDIVSYAGTGANRTVAHNLGVAPKMILIKNRDQADNWAVYHGANTAAPATDYLILNLTSATSDSANLWNDTAPTSSVFTVGIAEIVNTNTEEYIAYAFAEVEGFSAFGSYVGNANANGPMINLGFKPAWVMIKQADTSARDWIIQDATRNPFNAANLQLLPNASSAEATTFYSQSAAIDIVSNGFKVRSSAARVSENGANYVYAAFAEAPFKTANAR